MEVQTTERPATEAWAEEHPIRHARLVDQIAAKYPLERKDYCVWGAVAAWFGWRPEPSWYLPVGQGVDVYPAMQAHDSGRPDAEVWNLVDEALRAAGLC